MILFCVAHRRLKKLNTKTTLKRVTRLLNDYVKNLMNETSKDVIIMIL